MVSARWRIALNAARDAVHASASCRPAALPAGELGERTKRLTQEREAAAALLEAAARTEHVKLVRRLSAPDLSKEQLGLPTTTLACIFALDGVLAASAEIHFAAWAATFDEFLARRFERASIHLSHYERLSRRSDYLEHLHGKPRLEGVRTFLASRGITLPEGHPDDPPGAATVHGLANRKNEAFLRRLEHEGVSAFEGSHRYLEAAAAAGLSCVVVSASANAGRILERSGVADLIDLRIDGNAMRAEGLRAKPAPDTLLAACAQLGVDPERTAAFETTTAGIAAARAAGVALVVGVDRTGEVAALHAAGADLVVGDLTELLDRSRHQRT